MTVKNKNISQSFTQQTSLNSHVNLQPRDSEILTVFEGVTVNVEYVNSCSMPSKILEDQPGRKQVDLPTIVQCNPVTHGNLRSDHSNHRQCYRSSRKCLPLPSTNGGGGGSSNGNSGGKNGNSAPNSNNVSLNGVSINPSESFSEGTAEKEPGNEEKHAQATDKPKNDWLRSLFCLSKGGSMGGNQRADFIFHSQIPSSNLTAANPKTVLAKEKKAATQLGVIVGAFILCWLPYFTLFMVVAYCGEAHQCVSSTVHTVTIWFGYFNSTLNPILYPLCNRNFKRAFKRMFRLSSSSAPQTQNYHLSYLYQK